MKRSVRKAILRAARAASQQRHGFNIDDITITVDLPAAVAAAAPAWAPDGYAEVATAQRWARRDAPGLCHAIVTTYSAAEPGATVLASGLVTPDQLLGLGGLCDKPHRIRWMAADGTLAEEPLDAGHPAAAYQAWVTAMEDEARAALFPGPGHRAAYCPLSDNADLEHRTDGSWRVVLHADLGTWPGTRHGNAATVAGHVAALARHYGPGTRVRAYPWGHHQGPWEVTEPVYAAALTLFHGDEAPTGTGEDPKSRREDEQ